MREVRWYLQTSRPGHGVWRDQDDRVYSGWFYSSGDDEPSATVLAEYDKAVQELSWLDVRLVQETKSLSQTVLKEKRREEKEEICKCGHARSLHLYEAQACLYETDELAFACPCGEFEEVKRDGSD